MNDDQWHLGVTYATYLRQRREDMVDALVRLVEMDPDRTALFGLIGRLMRAPGALDRLDTWMEEVRNGG